MFGITLNKVIFNFLKCDLSKTIYIYTIIDQYKFKIKRRGYAWIGT